MSLVYNSSLSKDNLFRFNFYRYPQQTRIPAKKQKREQISIDQQYKNT